MFGVRMRVVTRFGISVFAQTYIGKIEKNEKPRQQRGEQIFIKLH